MRNLSALLAALVVANLAWAQDELPQKRGVSHAELKTFKDQRSYAIGLNVARSLQNDGLDLDLDRLFQGIRDHLTEGRKTLLTEEQLQKIFRDINEEMAEKEEQLKAENRRKGQEFLKANGEKKGVVTLPSGLQYRVLKAGKGPSPKLTDSVVVHYHGTLIDGTVFDSSVKRGSPASLQVNMVIPGWTEALQKMKVGDKWELYIPSELAYGPRGAGGAIGPNMVLIFQVELIGIEAE